tara:strand:- start:1455 stop:2060 length:606 start_codon:yes stop_codon:yes gene_type:complete
MKESFTKFNLYKDPIVLFAKWFKEAQQKEINDPNAMNLATISKNLKPTSRIVLLKSFDKEGFVFFSNSESKKGVSILRNKNVALNFYWKSLHKQVRIEGKASRISNKESDAYYFTRPNESKIGAWASQQSRKLDNRKILVDAVKKYKSRFKNVEIKRPHYWIGYRVKPNLIEFWKEMPFRLHDRLEFKRVSGKWSKSRLYP